MKEERKAYYAPPTITVVEVRMEGVVCQSVGVEDYSWNDYQVE